MFDAEPSEYARQASILCGVRGALNQRGRALSSAFLRDLREGFLTFRKCARDEHRVETKDIGEILDHARVNERVHNFFAHAVDIHLIAADKPLETFAESRRTRGIRAEELWSLALNRTVAHWALRWRLDGLLKPSAFLDERPHHLRNDLACLFDDDVITDAKVTTLNLLDVVKCRVLDG
jgi:hypothetical protein